MCVPPREGQSVNSWLTATRDGRARGPSSPCFFYPRTIVAQRAQYRLDDVRGVEARLVVLPVGRILVLEQVGQAHGADLEARIEQPLVARQRQHVRAETADRRFLDGD